MSISALNTGTYDTSLTAGSPANNKGAWTQLTASIGFDVKWLLVSGTKIFNAADKRALIDIGTGGAGSETVLIPNIPIRNDGTFWETYCGPILIPVNIPSGTRIAARCQCTTASETVVITVVAVSGTGTVTAINGFGAVTASSRGTAIDPGAVVNTKGTWVELISSTPADIDWLILIIAYITLNSTTLVHNLNIDIGTGGAGSEVVLIADINSNQNWGYKNTMPCTWGFPVSIPAGTRLSVRASSNFDGTGRTFDAMLIGVTGSGGAP